MKKKYKKTFHGVNAGVFCPLPTILIDSKGFVLAWLCWAIEFEKE